MKKSTKIVLAAVLAAVLIAGGLLAFLLTRGDAAYEVSLAQPIEVKWSGEIADRFEIVHVGAENDFGIPRQLFTIRPLDGKKYMIDIERPLHGYRLGKVEKLGENGYEPYFGLESRPKMTHEYEFIPYRIEPEVETEFLVSMPLWEEGHYRAVMTIRERNEDGSVGANTHELTLEYDVPPRSDEPIEVACASLMPYTAKTGEEFAFLELCVLANGKPRYVQPDSIKASGGIHVDSTISTREDAPGLEWLLERQVVVYNSDYLMQQYIPENVDFDAEAYMQMIALESIVLSDWVYGETYDLELTFTENEDGSGEAYTLKLRLNFDQ